MNKAQILHYVGILGTVLTGLATFIPGIGLPTALAAKILTGIAIAHGITGIVQSNLATPDASSPTKP